ncbi:MAG: glycosyltransferase family 39 protein [bacterium]|nr:glycosyltransferase family 39 protein [bacterium]
MKLLKDLQPSKTPAIDIIIIALLCAIIGYLDYRWHGLCLFPPTADYAMHFAEAASFHNALQHASGLSGILAAWIWPSLYPAGMYLIAHIYMTFAGTGVEQILLSQLLLIPFLVSSLYYLARPRLGITAGIAAVLSASIIPELFINTDHYLVDHGQDVFVLVALSLLVNYCDFKSRSAAIFLGISIGYAELVKYTSFVFIIIPFIISVFIAIYSEKPRKSIVAAHFFLAVSSFIIPYFTASRMNITQSADVLTGGTIFKADSLKLLTLAFLCWIIWIAGITFLNKYSRTLSNIAYCASLSFILGFPWFICNHETVAARRSSIRDIFLNNIRLDNLQNGLNEYYHLFPNAAYIALLAAAILFLFTKHSCKEDRLIALSAFSSLIANYLMLSFSIRYAEASFVMNMILIVCFLSRIKFGDLLALALFSLTFTINAVWPFILGNEAALGISSANNTCLQKVTNYYNCTIPVFNNQKASGFNAAAETAPLLCLPGKPALVFICADEKDSDESLQYSEDMCRGLQCWSEMHDCQIVPAIYNFSSKYIMIPSEYYLSRLAFHLRNSLPELLSLHGLVLYGDNFNGKLSLERVDFLVCHQPKDNVNQPLDRFDSQILQKLGDNADYEEISSNSEIIRIWKRKANIVEGNRNQH